MNIITNIEELETRVYDGIEYIICRVSMNGNLAFVLKTEAPSTTNYSYSKDFEFDYEEGNEKELGEYRWSIVEQIVK
jgi:hypothetical protein